MRQFHARAHFSRVEIIDAKRREILVQHRTEWIGSALPAMETERYKRLCRAAAMYRVAGYVRPQEI